MFGFYNRLLEIDITKKAFTIKAISDELLHRTLGGKGLATHLLLQNNPPQVDPLSRDNHLIIATGPVADTAVWGSCRHGVFTKSPQTGYYSESYAGGTAAEYMARTGYDAVMIKGGSHDPVWIEVSEERASFHPGQDFWGLESYTAEDRVKAWIKENRADAKNCGVVCIGPAGENLVAFAGIENDYWRSAGRTGVGAVMGSKGIKAIAFWGNKKKELADPELVNTFAKHFSEKAKDDKGVRAYKNMGTPMMVDIMSGVGSFPTHYWHKGRARHQENINAGALHRRLNVLPHACRRCFIACGRLATVKQGRHKGLKIEGPEYETIYALGGLCEVDSIEEIAYLNDICDRLGLDTISAGNLVALTIEASRQERINYDIDYGQVDKIAGLLEDIVYRRGIGDTLARGIKAVAKAWNMEDQAIHVKGMEPAGYDPRVLKGMGLAYGTSDRGACHLRTTFYKPELANMIDPDQTAGKAEMLAEWEDRLTIFDSLILCRFYRDLYQWEELATVIKGITGLEVDKGRMRSVAGVITDNTRQFNIREGLSPQEDRLPKRFYTEELPETGKVITEKQMEQLLADYYHARGWDENGIPPGNA
jgi:aldehyde:ferredoxin oxidoreductase